MSVSRTKIVGWLLIVGAFGDMMVDALDGGGFDLSVHVASLVVALNGAGFIFMRDAIKKLQNGIG